MKNTFSKETEIYDEDGNVILDENGNPVKVLVPAEGTTPRQIFEISMALTDNLNDVGGDEYDGDNTEYQYRVISILNMLIGECYPYSDTYKFAGPKKRPICEPIISFDQTIALDDYICRTVLPYGLCANLLVDENPASAGFFEQRYEELLRRLMSMGLPTMSENIIDVYGGGGMMFNEESGEWEFFDGYGDGIEWSTRW